MFQLTALNGSTVAGVHEHSQNHKAITNHRCQNADIWEVPNPGPTKFRHRLQYLGPGICISPDHHWHFTTAMYYFHLCTILRYRFDMCVRDFT